jgi:hypothetical protein
VNWTKESVGPPQTSGARGAWSETAVSSSGPAYVSALRLARTGDADVQTEAARQDKPGALTTAGALSKGGVSKRVSNGMVAEYSNGTCLGRVNEPGLRTMTNGGQIHASGTCPRFRRQLLFGRIVAISTAADRVCLSQTTCTSCSFDEPLRSVSINPSSHRPGLILGAWTVSRHPIWHRGPGECRAGMRPCRTSFCGQEGRWGG